MIGTVDAGLDSGSAPDAHIPDAAPGYDSSQALEASAPGPDAIIAPPEDAGSADASDASAGSAGLRVQVQEGTLEGKSEGTTRAFLGVPYAQAPIGALRFAFPVAFPAWQGVRPAKEFGAACPQPGETGAAFGLPKLLKSEDCLFLNVHTPEGSAGRKLPVMVWIHGGSGISGTGAEYDGRFLSEVGQVIVVTLNYRLGALSSLALPALDAALNGTSGNLAVRDEQLALSWVQRNIEAFGGDAANVTLFGESNGSISTCFHIFAKGSDKLIRRFIMQSGGCLGSAINPASRAQMQSTSQDVVTALCPQSTDVVTCLRALSVEQLIAYKNNHTNVLEQIGGLYVDGDLMPDLPARLVRQGKFNKGPILLGSNLHEARFLASPAYGTMWPLVADALSYSIGVTAMYPNSFLQIFGHYGLPSDADANETLVRVMDDSWFRCPARALARAVAAQGVSAYLYSFELAPAVHTQDIDYVFGFPDGRASKPFQGAPVPPVPALLNAMQSYWLAFAKTGDPNTAGTPAWPKYDASSDAHQVLNTSISTGTKLSASDCDFWDSVLLPPTN